MDKSWPVARTDLFVRAAYEAERSLGKKEKQMLRIKFDSKDDRVKGFYELATKGVVRALKGDVFEIPEYCKKILDDAGVPFHILSECEETLDEALRNIPTH